MMRSMTGYGRREAAWSGGSIVVEIRSVNHRFREIAMRLPRRLAALEDSLKDMIHSRCARGRIDLTVTLTGGAEGRKVISLDRSLVKQYYRLLLKLQRELRLGGTIDMALVAGLRDVFMVSEPPFEDQKLSQTMKRLVSAAVSDLDQMRRREGRLLTRHLTRLLTTVRKELAVIATRVPTAVNEHFERMKTRVATLLGDGHTDDRRLQQELALFADRCDISEELARLESHLSQFSLALNSREPVGKTMDFLLQEMGREINTVGAKANDAQIAARVVRVKGELEKMREQVHNIE